MKTNPFIQAVLVILWLFFPLLIHAQEFGITSQDVSKISDTGHNVQLWEVLPDFTKNGTYEVRIKHAVAGNKGSFFITAWADTNNDGIPDLEIGRSELKTATEDGAWSSWQFRSNFSRIFVGNTWNLSDEKVYYQNGGSVDGYTGLSNKVFYSRSFNGKPTQSTSPRFTNIKVKVLGNSNYFGITKSEVERISDTGHNLQIWEVLPEYTKEGTYEISIKHAVAGDKGSFFITAWADTNNDGIPDVEIGRSALKTAISDGEWSSWTFNSNYPRIFVGNTWNKSDENVYYQSGGSIDGYTGLSNKVFYARSFNGIPSQSTSPRFTNIRVKFIQ